MRRLLFFPVCILAFSLGFSQDSPDRWLVHYTRDGGGFSTAVRLINTDFAASHTMTLTPYGADGTLLSGLVRSVEVSPGQASAWTRADLDWADQPVSHLTVSGSENVRVSATYQSLAPGAMPAEANAQAGPATMARLVPVTGSAWFDGLVVVNPGEANATLRITAHDAAGNTLQTTERALAAHAKWLDLAASLFEESGPVDGYYQIDSDQPVLFFALRGSLPGLEPAVLTEVRMDTFRNDPPPVTFSNQVSRIIDRKCSYCHLEGGIGPFPMTNFTEVVSVRNFIEFSVGNGDMPPWKASDDCAEFVGSQALDPVERAMMLDWLQNGFPEGEPERAPAAKAPLVNEWTYAVPDEIMEYSEPYSFEPGPDVYRCFPMALNNSEPRYVSAVEILPGNPEIVHHVLVFLEDNTLGQSLDAGEPGPGYTCFGGPGTGGFRLIAGWAPGMVPQVYPEGVGVTLPPNATLVVQVHYHYSGAAGSDLTKIGLSYNGEQHEKELLFLPLVNTNFTIPPGAKDHVVQQSVTLPNFVSAELYLIAPHMHLLGKTISVQLSLPEGDEQCLVDIPKWDFNWQRFYEYPAPIQIPGGSTVSLHCTYDNSDENPFNPYSPPRAVGWGEETTDEMALAFLGITTPVPLFGKNRVWEWPLKIENVIGKRGKTPASQAKLPPSCCQPGKERPWCPAQEKATAGEAPAVSVEPVGQPPKNPE